MGRFSAMQQDDSSYLQHIVQAALLRSLGTIPQTIPFDGGVIVLLGEGSSWSPKSPFQGKALVFGTPAPSMLSALGLRASEFPSRFVGSDACLPAEGDRPFTESAAFLAHSDHLLSGELAPVVRRRPFTRFDYADEWNNMGFGRIRTDNSVWSACGGIIPEGAVELAGMFLHSSSGDPPAYCGSYLTLYDTPSASVLWCARPVGPVDSTEWTVIERFISDWRAEDLPCLPCLCQTPAGCRCLVTMRLDCDEAVGSARNLFEWYRQEGIPFSLAVKTSLDLGQEDMTLLEDVRASGGSLLSHTHTHQPNWGTTPDEAQADAEASRRWFAETWPGRLPTDLAVSPFHTNPPYAVQAIEQAGFTGFVSGIIHNDPEYLLGRAGRVPFARQCIVSISQQSMLHGDCYRRQEGKIAVHVAAFEAQYAARGIFGYLDHPFSTRYQYDWQNEQERLQAHQKLVAAIRQYEGVWFWNQERCFDFVRALASIRLHVSRKGLVTCNDTLPKDFSIAYRYKGSEYVLA